MNAILPKRRRIAIRSSRETAMAPTNQIPERPAAAVAAAGDGGRLGALSILPQDSIIQSAVSIMALSCGILVDNKLPIDDAVDLVRAFSGFAFVMFLIGVVFAFGGAGAGRAGAQEE